MISHVYSFKCDDGTSTMPVSTIRLANEAWEAFSRAQVTLLAELTAGMPHTDHLASSENAVLSAPSNASAGQPMTELGEDVLITQPGMSRLIVRLEGWGYVERTDDPDDGRACRIRLTPVGAEIQRRVGRAHARQVMQVMSRALSRDQLETLRDLSQALLDDAHATDGVAGTHG